MREDRFWSKVDDSGDCWEWTANSRNHYGRYWVDGKSVYSHRHSYEIAFGPIPSGHHVCHSCDNSLCVRPDHLFLGTPSDNIEDKVAKDRQARGVSIAQSKLSDTQVREILTDTRSQRSIANTYQVSQSLISYIRQRKYWKHIEAGK